MRTVKKAWVQFGADGDLPAGYARCTAGTDLVRGHSPGKVPDWFGPGLGNVGINRFDAPKQTTTDHGTCYLARSLEGVLLERVLRGVWRPVVSRSSLMERHAITAARPTRDLIFLDLCLALNSVHRLQISDISQPPPYTRTQNLARRWARQSHPVAVDGILYTSRFAPAARCIALWDRAASAVEWGTTGLLGADIAQLSRACVRLGIGIID